MNESYWLRTMRKRLSRRRALAGAALGAGALAVSLSCGGSDDDGDGGATKDKSGLLFTPSDSTKQATKGGIWQSFLTTEPPQYDPLSTGSIGVFTHSTMAYQRFFSFKPGTYEEAPDGSVEGDALSSWEIAPDGLTVTMKLRPNNKLDPRPPTNSRPVDTGDVKWSWERFLALQPRRTLFSNALSPDAPVTSMTFPDSTTIVMKLAFPHSAITKLFGTIYYFAVLPVEADGKFDPRQDMRGSAAWMLTKYERSQGWEYRRNPNWFKQPDRPFLEGIDFALLPEPVQQLAQFKAKRVWASDLTITTPVSFPVPDQLLSVKREIPEALMRSLTPFRGNANYYVIGMGKKPDSPFEQDPRLRHAVAYLIDRAPWIEAFNNLSGFEKEGLPLEVGWHSHVPCSFYGVWLDPQDEKEFGPNAKYFQYNPDEAAKLLRAAGKFGLEQDFTYHGVGGFGGPQYPRQMEVFAQMLQAGGHFKLNIKVEDYNAVITPNFTFSHGQYNGITAHPFGSWADWDLGMWNAYTPSGGNDVVGHDTPELKEIMVRHRRELDAKKRVEIAHEWQRKIPEYMPVVPFPGEATRFILHWPWLANVGWYDAAGGGVPSNETFIHLWYDKSKDTRSS